MGRERILGYLWPDQPSDAGRHQLSEALYVLRKAVGESVFVTAGDEVGLNPAILGTDVAAFRAAMAGECFRDAVALYRGPFLDGFHVSDAPEFERWAEEVRSSLSDAYGTAVEALAEQCERAADFAGAAGWWRRRAVHDPYSSRIALRLMHALAAGGERGAALKHAAAHGVFLREELGVDPDPEVGEAMHRLAAETAALPRLVARAPAEDEPFVEGEAPAEEEVFAEGEAPARGAEPEAEAGGDAGAAPEEDFSRAGEDGEEHRTAGSGPAPPAAASVGGPLAHTGPASAALVPPTTRGALLARFAGHVGAAALGALLIVGLLRLLPGVPASDASQEALDIRRIAVMPFEASGDPEHQALADAITGSLIDRLSGLGTLRVIPRRGVMPYAGRAVVLDSITRRLRVGTLVTGRLQRSGAVYRVDVQMVDGITGEQLASTQVQVAQTELFALQDAVSAQVERFLRRRLGDQVRLREHRAGTRSASAYALAVRADGFRARARRVALHNDPLDVAAAAALLQTADSLLHRAQQEDRQWVQPRIDRAWVWVELSGLTSGTARVQALQAALGHAAAALDLDGENAAALEVRGTASWRLSTAVSEAPDSLRPNAERDLRAATLRAPELARAWSTLSQLLRMKGALAESEQAAERALEEDAFLEEAPAILDRMFRSTMMLGDYAGAARWCGRGGREFPNDWRFLDCQLLLLREDPGVSPDPARAWALVARLEVLDPPAKARQAGNPYSPIFRRLVAASVSARVGDGERARAELARARRDVGNNRELAVDLKYDEAYVRLVLGERNQALRLLREYLAVRHENREFILRDRLFADIVPGL
ncbi:BTAD domain-containing putative transcriptional regulator [Longimicrobium terrae]|uniref:BTAD domain-containing putative transcriptional regulator n=1 Tax=Longimicrobium terrae TaxID=1639882 RepID=UPI0014751D23|nr:hypothetical protein [Longimicrobium terrae]